MKLQDIKLKDYERLKIKTPYEVWFEKLPARNILLEKKGKDRTQWTFDEVDFLRNYINEFDEKYLKLLKDICFPELQAVRVVNLYLLELISWRKFVIAELEAITEMEATISSDTDPVLTASGIDTLQKYKGWNTKIDLGIKFGQTPQSIGKWLWQDVFVIMKRESDKANIEKKYFELKNKKK